MGLELSICDGFKGAENGKGRFASQTSGISRQNATTFCDTKSPPLDERALQSEHFNS